MSSNTFRQEVTEEVKRIAKEAEQERYIDLSCDPDYMKIFVDRICSAAKRMGERMDNTPLMGIEIPTILPDNWFSRREGAALERDSFRAHIAKECL